MKEHMIIWGGVSVILVAGYASYEFYSFAKLRKKQPPHRNPNSTLMASSAIKVAMGLALIVVVLATVGKLIEEWATVLWLVSLGGRFWGAVSVGLICVASATWAGLVSYGMREREAPIAPGASKRKATCLFWLDATLIAGLVIFLVANVALYASYGTFSGLNIYQQIAVAVMHGSIVIGILILSVHAAIEGGDH
ncbi:hypothetical protein [Achromobacter kerstersii]|uniref:Uncharacterized protein n=1 Tax=Achromobacter kerstersii TaxID=1353890 RepID=A0A6S7C875_9BURK|nr:hypothetical protein [Achromobacter kerstersii]CAB3743259.1 hypothetical protein LMG3441_05966 [Achromobacter kerstersii]